jgi:hypothetical protein
MLEFFATNTPDVPHWNLNSWCRAFHTFWLCFGPFDYNTKLGAKRVKLVQLVQKFVPRRCVGIFRDERTQATPLDPKHMFWCVSYSLGAFGTVLLPDETNFKTGRTGQLMQKFVPRSHFRIFCNERIRCTPLDPKLMIWCVSYTLGMFQTIWLLHKSRCKTGQTGAISTKVRATKVCRHFSRRTHPIHPIGPYTHVLVRFVLVGCIWDRFVALWN